MHQDLDDKLKLISDVVLAEIADINNQHVSKVEEQRAEGREQSAMSACDMETRMALLWGPYLDSCADGFTAGVASMSWMRECFD